MSKPCVISIKWLSSIENTRARKQDEKRHKVLSIQHTMSLYFPPQNKCFFQECASANKTRSVLMMPECFHLGSIIPCQSFSFHVHILYIIYTQYTTEYQLKHNLCLEQCLKRPPLLYFIILYPASEAFHFLCCRCTCEF